MRMTKAEQQMKLVEYMKLRNSDLSKREIAKRLGVNKNTLGYWERHYFNDSASEKNKDLIDGLRKIYEAQRNLLESQEDLLKSFAV